ncbi:MAG: DUF1513 domain-containing protein [Pseudomonadota bacterium]
MMNRRSFLAAAGSGFAASLVPSAADAFERADAIFATAYRDEDGGYGIATLTDAGRLIDRYQLPERGHDIFWHASGEMLVAFARRPGTFAAVIDVKRRKKPLIIQAAEGRHFYGHGCFDPAGKLLYATENDFENARGVIGIYDVTNAFRRIGEFDTGGIGPHDMVPFPDGYHALIANGGIETHPDYPRAKLNISTMRPNLTIIDLRDGRIVALNQLAPEMHKLSIRHLAMQADGTGWFACQNQGDIVMPQPLAGKISPDGEIKLMETAMSTWASLRGYIGAIACTKDGSRIAVTSPRAAVALEIDPRHGRVLKTHHLEDVCGVIARDNQITLSSGTGFFAGKRHQISFDNHITRLGI